MNKIVIFGSTQSGKTTLLGYLATAMLRHPQLNEEILKNFKLIKKLTTTDEFSIGNPYNPVNVNKDIILPSFVSLDKDELRKFEDGNTEGTTKRLHRKEITICISERDNAWDYQDENENISCTFMDIPGFRQKLSDKYRGFFEGDTGIAVLKLQEVKELNWHLEKVSKDNLVRIDDLERRLFEPLRIWCDYRSPSTLMIALSQIDRSYLGSTDSERLSNQISDISSAIETIRLYTSQFDKGVHIPISPISIDITAEKNIKDHYRMGVFFRRQEDNVYFANKALPGDGTFISCLKSILHSKRENVYNSFSMASVYRPMKAKVNGSYKTALNVHAIHGTIKLNDKLILGPVVDKNDNDIVFVECEISSIKADGAKSTSEKLLEGNAGGLVFDSISDIDNKRKYYLSSDPKQSEISLLKSTILFSGEIFSGDTVELEISKKDHLNIDNTLDSIYGLVLPSIMPFDDLVLFWYGKKINVSVMEVIILDDKIRLSVSPSKNSQNTVRIFALPKDKDGSLRHKDSTLFAVPRMYYSSRQKKDVQGMYTYVSCNIVRIRRSECVTRLKIETNIDIDITELFEGIENVTFDGCSASVFINNNKQEKSIFTVLTKIGRNTRNWVNRKYYRQIGGINVKLIE